MRFFIFIVLFVSLSYAEIIELNHESLSTDSIMWPSPNAKPFTQTVLAKGMTEEGYWLSANDFCSPEHIGTHMDAPSHFSQHGWSMDQIPPERLIAPAAVIDIRHKVKTNNIYLLTARDILDWVDENGMFLNNSIVFVHTGWGKRYGNRKAYFGHESDKSQFMFPAISKSAAETLIEFGRTSDINIIGIGIDTPSVDLGPSKTQESHVVLCNHNIYILENVANLDKVDVRIPEVIAMPLKLRNGSGSPCRLLARTEMQNDASSLLSTPVVLIVSTILCLFNFF